MPASDRAMLDFIVALRERGVLQFTLGPMQVVLKPLPETSKHRPRRRKKIGFATEKSK
jgi:hypothetical protein